MYNDKCDEYSDLLSVIQKEIRLQTAARMGAFAALKSAGLVEDTVIGVELRGGGMGLNKYENPEGESFGAE